MNYYGLVTLAIILIVVPYVLAALSYWRSKTHSRDKFRAMMWVGIVYGTAWVFMYIALFLGWIPR